MSGLSHSLLSELYDLEEDAYRLSFREARRDRSPPSQALRAIAGHAGESLEDLPALAHARGLRLSSARNLTLDVGRRVRDLIVHQLIDHEHSFRRVLTAVHKGVDLVRVVDAAAVDEIDDRLAQWCRSWLSAREALLAAASDELVWFGRHPFFATLPSAPFPIAEPSRTVVAGHVARHLTVVRAAPIGESASGTMPPQRAVRQTARWPSAPNRAVRPRFP